MCHQTSCVSGGGGGVDRPRGGCRTDPRGLEPRHGQHLRTDAEVRHVENDYRQRLLVQPRQR